jgi:hypothetical protein
MTKTPVNIIFSMLVHNTLSQILGKKRRDPFFKRYGKARHGDESKKAGWENDKSSCAEQAR